jgi:hypothetical protein
MKEVINVIGTEAKFHFIQTNDSISLHNFTDWQKSEEEKQLLNYPTTIASGYIKVGSTEKGLSHRLVNYTLKSDLFFEKKPSTE